MRFVTFKNQIIFGVILIIICNAMSFAFHNGIYVNVAWIIYGVVFILNPVYPEKYISKNKGEVAARISGIICIIIGIFTKFIV